MRRKGRAYEALLKEACRKAILSLTEDEWIGTVEANGYAWDVYVHSMPMEHRVPAVTVSLRTEADERGEPTVIVGSFLLGALTLEEVRETLREEEILQ